MNEGAERKVWACPADLNLFRDIFPAARCVLLICFLSTTNTPQLAAGIFYPLHLPLSPSCQPMRVLGAVVQIPALPVFDAGKQMALRDAGASQLVGHDHRRHILQSIQQSSEETLGSVGITPILNQNVEHDAVLIHRPPKTVLYRHTHRRLSPG